MSGRVPWYPHPPEKRYLLKKYGLTTEEWWALYKVQEGCCAICGAREKPLQVDHDHRADPKKTTRRHLLWNQRGAVRGLLCWPCNQALQGFRDRAEDMWAAAWYIENPPAWALWPEEKREAG